MLAVADGASSLIFHLNRTIESLSVMIVSGSKGRGGRCRMIDGFNCAHDLFYIFFAPILTKNLPLVLRIATTRKDVPPHLTRGPAACHQMYARRGQTLRA